MEEYINENTIIKNDIYKSLKDSIYCPICKNLMIEPFMCSGCQDTFCKKCVENIEKEKKTCPNKCESPAFKKVISKHSFISKMSFQCIKGCGAEISFNDIKNHYSSNCQKDANINPKNVLNTKKGRKNGKIKFLTMNEINKLRKRDEKINYMSSKIN